LRVIYVAGQYRSDTNWGQTLNIQHAERAAMKLWLEGWVVFCPHLNTQLFDWALPQVSSKTWLKGGIEILKRCDAIYMLKGFRSSLGAMKEYKFAKKLGLEIQFEDPLDNC